MDAYYSDFVLIIIFLVLLLRQNQKKMKKDIYQRALDSEQNDPQGSMRLYSILQNENQYLSLPILFASVSGPVGSYFLILWIRSHYNIQNVFFTLLLWVGIGVYPGLLTYEWKRRQSGFIKLEHWYNIIYLIIVPFLIYFGTLAHIFVISLVAAFCAFPLYLLVGFSYYFFSGNHFSFDSLFLLPRYLDIPIMVLSLSYGFLMEMSDPVRVSDPLILYLFKFRRMFIALRLRLKEAVFFLIVITVTILIQETDLNSLIGEPKVDLTLSVLGGLFFSLGYGFIEHDVAKGHLYRIALIRCALNMNRAEEADLRLMLAEKNGACMFDKFINIKSAYPQTIIPLLQALKQITDVERMDIKAPRAKVKDLLSEASILFDDAEEGIKGKDPNYKYYLDSIRKSEETLNLVTIKYLTYKFTCPPNKDHLKYSSIARVLKSDFFYPPGEDPNEYERWEYEYYKSGQKIDIEVTSGEIFLDKPYKKGEVAIGIWGSGKTEHGFIQIYDKLKPGDMVGYFTFRESFGANIIAFERIKSVKVIYYC